MTLESMGAMLLVLVAVFIFSQVWFHLIEGILTFIKRLLTRKSKASAWYPLLPQEDEKQ